VDKELKDGWRRARACPVAPPAGPAATPSAVSRSWASGHLRPWFSGGAVYLSQSPGVATFRS